MQALCAARAWRVDELSTTGRKYARRSSSTTKAPKLASRRARTACTRSRPNWTLRAHISEGSISLRDGIAERLDGPLEVGSGTGHDEDVPLSRLIDVVNERFGTDFADADQLFFDQIIEAAIADGSLREAASVNPEEKFALLFSGLLKSQFIERMEQNEDIFARFMNERNFQNLVSEWISRKVNTRFRPPRTPAEIAAVKKPAHGQ